MATIIFILGLVILQDLFQFKNLTPLAGYYTNPNDVVFSWQDWKQGKYQQQKEEYLSKCFHLRDDFVRLNNTLHYSLFKTSNIDWVVFGKQHQLMDKKQVDAYLGKDAIPIEEIKQTTQYLKEVQDTLKKLGKQIFVVVPPNKPSIYPEYIPKTFDAKEVENNYESFTREFKKNNINYIDLVEYFKQLKLSGKKDLFAISGSHWNTNGAANGLIYTMKYINSYYNQTLGSLEIKSEPYKKERWADLDIYATLNLFSTSTNDTTIDPELIINTKPSPRPKALFITDSFFDAWIDMGVYEFFDSTTYYFYNDNIIGKDRNGTNKKLSTEESLDKYDVFVVLCNESNMDDLGWGFIQQLHLHFFPKAPVNILYDKYYQKKVRSTMDFIKKDTAWHHDIEKKAAQNNLFIDKQLYLDAVWSIHNGHKITLQ